jgi:hypothetical protein
MSVSVLQGTVPHVTGGTLIGLLQVDGVCRVPLPRPCQTGKRPKEIAENHSVSPNQRRRSSQEQIMGQHDKSIAEGAILPYGVPTKGWLVS